MGFPGRLGQAATAFGRTARVPNLRRAQLSFGTAWASYWAITVALGVIAYGHGGATTVGIVGLVRMLPAAVLAPAASVVVDRIRRDRVLVGVGLVRAAALSAAALVLVTVASPWPVYGLVAVDSLAHTMYRPAHTALLPSLCTTADELTSSNAVRGLLDAVSALVGPLLAGLLVGPVGIAGVFVVSGALGLWSSWFIGRVEYEAAPRLAEAGQSHPLREVTEGLAVMRRKPEVGTLATLGTLQTFTRGCFSVFAVVVALQLLGLTSFGVGVLTAAFGAGAVLGSFGASLLVGSPRLARWFGVGVAGWGLPFIALAVVSSEPPALLLLAVVGVANAIVDVALDTILQWVVPEELMGRVFTSLESVFTFGVAAGSIAASGLIAILGIRGALIVAGLIAPVGVSLALSRLRRIDAEHQVADEIVSLLQRVAMLRPLPLATICRLASEASREARPAGAIVVEEGAREDDFYVIAAGRAEVSVDGRGVRRLSRADCFGEIAGLRGAIRTATVRADTTLELLRINGSHFVRAVTGYTPSSEAAARLVKERMAHAASTAAHGAPSAPDRLADAAGQTHIEVITRRAASMSSASRYTAGPQPG